LSTPALPPEVAAAFEAFPGAVRRRLLQVRQLIFNTAATLQGVGPLTETLKWGEPAYLTAATGTGSTIRLGRAGTSEATCAVLFNCRTTLVESFRERFADSFAYDKNRALLLSTTGRLPAGPLSSCLAMALTYHRRGRAAQTTDRR
jgi:hypothetical protein